MPKLMPLVPSLGAVGPLLIVIGIDSPYHIISFVGALTTSIAIMIVFATVAKILKSQPTLK